MVKMINFIKKIFYIFIFSFFNLFSILIENISENELNELIKKNNIVIIEFYATWCGPCQKMLPIFKSTAQKYLNIYFVTLNIDNNKKLAEKYNVISIPTIIFIKNKKVILTNNGLIQKNEFIKKIESILK